MTECLNEHFGQRLAAIREALELKQSNIGDALGCSNGAYSLYERNKRQPPLSVLFNLCEKFGVSIDYLIGCFSPFPDLFAERLKETLDRREGKTLHEFAEVFDLDSSTGKLLLSGKCFPSAKVLKNLCRYLNCSADYLIGLSDSMDPPNEVPISIGITTIPRQQDDPFADLDPDLRSKAEGYLDGLRDQQNARRQAPQNQEA